MKLLEPNHWNTQYSLSLQLFELSASVSCMDGDIASMSSRLNEVITNVKSFDDSLTSSSLLAKLLASSSKYTEAIQTCLSVLQNLGQEFSPDVDPSLEAVTNELEVVQTTLANITLDQVKSLPKMTHKYKRHAMKFMSMLSTYAIISKPMLVPLLSCRSESDPVIRCCCPEKVWSL